MFKNSKSIALALTLAGSLAVSGAQAADTYAAFNFYKNGGGAFDAKSTSLSFTDNGIKLTISPVSASDNPKVTYRWDGIGLYAGGLDAPELNSSLLHSPGDALLFTFSHAVSLNAIALSLWEGNSLGALDKATITTGGQTYALNASLNDGGLLVDHFGLTGLIPAGTSFVLQAQGSLSSFRLAGLNVMLAAPVPEASTMAMFGLGLLGVAAAARRRIKG